MQEQRLIYLLEQFRSNATTPAELEELSSLSQYNGDADFFHGALSTLMELYPAQRLCPPTPPTGWMNH